MGKPRTTTPRDPAVFSWACPSCCTGLWSLPSPFQLFGLLSFSACLTISSKRTRENDTNSSQTKTFSSQYLFWKPDCFSLARKRSTVFEFPVQTGVFLTSILNRKVYTYP